MYENLSIPLEKQYAELHAQSHYLKPHVRKTLMTPNQFIRESKRFETKRAMHLLRKKKANHNYETKHCERICT